MSLLDWIDDRTGIRRALQVALYERIPGGARWRFVWGSTLVFGFIVQVITGFCLWAAYSPSVQHAWASVFYIEHQMMFGSIIRGVHHYTAQMMVVLMAFHFLQVIIDGAYRAPREFNYWLGLKLMLIVFGLALTGYLLPWDQKGYYATQVATKIMGATPFVGEALQKLVQGGTEYGQHTLTRFFALHAGVLPTALVGTLALHILLFRRHGITVRADLLDENEKVGVFWPDQILKDSLACLAVFGIVFALAWFRPAELNAPADPSEPFAAARPEWYFLSLFRFLKFEAVEHLGLAFGAIIVPGVVFVVLFLLPFIAKLPGGHTINVCFTCVLSACIAILTAMAWYEDSNDPAHQDALAVAHQDASRVRELAGRPGKGIPVEGAVALLREDPLAQGPRIYAQHCAACHHYNGHNGLGSQLVELDPDSGEYRPAKPSAADLGNLGSREWMRAVLTDFSNHFAAIKNATWFGDADGIDPEDSEMADWSGDHEALVSKENEADLSALVEFLIQQTGRADLNPDDDLADRGREIAVDGEWKLDALEGISCADCHGTVGEEFDPSAGGDAYPDIAEYLSAAWLRDFIANPDDEQHYGDRNHMPAYRDALTDREIDLLVRWFTADYYRPNETAN